MNRSVCLLLSLVVFSCMAGSALGQVGKESPITSNLETEKTTTGLREKVASSLTASVATKAPSTPSYEGWQLQLASPAGGGAVSTVAGEVSGGTIGQVAVGKIGSGDTWVYQGLWLGLGEQELCCVMRGDIDHDGEGPFITDLLYLVNYMFGGGAEPPCMDEADVDGSGEVVIIDDLIYLVHFMFHQGEALASCP